MATVVTRRFSVHARHLERHHTRLLEEASFEAAAIAYAEDFAVVAGDGDEISVIVRDLEDGHERCFAINLQSGDANACA